MLGTIDVEIQALNPNMPLHPWCAYVNSPSSLRLRNVPKRIGDWHITSVKIVAIYPNGEIKSAECVLTGGIWVGTVAGTSTSGTSQNGYTIFADGVDENNQPVTGYVLGKGDITILEADGTLSPDAMRYYVKLLSAEAEQPREGDMYPTSDGYVVWQNGQANQLGTPFEQITAYVDSAISSKQDLLSEGQLSAISHAQKDMTTAIQYSDGTYDAFILSSNTLSKNTLKELGALADDGVTWLKEPMYVSTGSNVTWIDTGVFMNATHLFSFTGKNVAILQGNTFNGCTALRSVDIPKIEQIGTQIFYNCTSLTSLTLPKSLTTVGRNGFAGNSFNYVLFEGKSLEDLRAMSNYSRWQLPEDKIRTYVYRDYVDEAISSKADLSALNAKADVSALSDYIPFAIDNSGGKTAMTIGYRTVGEPVGVYSFSSGSNNAATGLNSLAVGSFNNVSGDNAVAIGTNNIANNNLTLAVGNANKLSGNNSIGIGNSNIVSGNWGAAIGYSNHVDKIFGMALGTRATAHDSGCYVWNGTNKTVPIGLTEYSSHGVGTFNINPVGGLSGVYVGETNLGDYLSQVDSAISSKAEISSVPTKTSQLSNDSGYITASDPYIGGWRVELSRPQGGDGGATFVGRVMSDSGKNILLNGTLVETDIAALEDYIDEQYNLWLNGNYLSAVVDGAELSSGIAYHMLEFNDLYWFAAGDYPRDNMRTNFGMARLYRR